MASHAFDSARALFPRHDKTTYTAAEMAEMLIDPYDSAPKYSQATVGILGGVIALFALGNIVSTCCKHKYGARVARTRGYRRAVAAYRYVASNQPKAVGWIRFPTIGTILMLSALWIVLLVWSIAVQPYYRSRWNVGSPPFAIRTGMMALGLFPYILALGAKWNIIGFVTGVSHEKLQVYHQWLSHLFLILSLCHTFPFVVQGTREIRTNADGLNPHHYSQLYYSWHVSHKVYYWSGVGALVPLAWLCWGSITPLRNRSYELFKALHIISAILFTAFFYIHCNKLLTSWTYFYYAAAVYGISIAMRFGLMFVRNGLHVPKAHVEALADNAMRVTVHLPAGSPHRWEAGQHFFVNFVRVLPFESHPYTVANAPYADASSSTFPDKLVLIFRINPTRGLGPRLLKLAASSNPSTPVLLDGPYGVRHDFGRHNTVVLVAGGAGITHSTAILEELAGRILRDDSSVEKLKRIEVHWAVKNEDAKTWIDDQLSNVLHHLFHRKNLLSLNLYVTETPSSSSQPSAPSPALATSSALEYNDKTKEDLEFSSSKSGSSSSAPAALPWTLHPLSTRPDIPSLLASIFSSSSSFSSGSTIGIGACGPESLTTDVRRAVAKKQKEIALGRCEGGVEEVELVTEAFDW